MGKKELTENFVVVEVVEMRTIAEDKDKLGKHILAAS